MLNLPCRCLVQMCIFCQSKALIENKFMLHTDTTNVAYIFVGRSRSCEVVIYK